MTPKYYKINVGLKTSKVVYVNSFMSVRPNNIQVMSHQLRRWYQFSRAGQVAL